MEKDRGTVVILLPGPSNRIAVCPRNTLRRMDVWGGQIKIRGRHNLIKFTRDLRKQVYDKEGRTVRPD